eukprot:TRINITY_DN4436_c0_g1_i1.p1 TRINITY_DN4436_c0_g1~~TRINITY_DN4436_c0_g1_i1.p1  ORF type:complete len:528 (+),score=55.79 TRINITY_DN4436_c0_g1_i1:70-1653(+)
MVELLHTRGVPFVFVLLLVVFFGVGCQALISSLRETISTNSPRIWRFAVITMEDAPFGNTPPYLNMDYDLTLQPSVNLMPDTQIVLFHHQNLNTKVGATARVKTYSVDLMQSRQWCCNQDLVDEGKCSDPTALYIQGVANWTSVDQKYLLDSSGTIYYWKNFKGYQYNQDKHSSTISQKIVFNKTGIWYLLVLECNQSHSVFMDGVVEWHNPYGYLSGVLFPFLPMYVSISSAFCCLLIVWVIFVLKYRQNLMGLQHVITVVISVAFAENVLWSYDYINSNITGLISDPINMIGALLTASKLTLIRTCILLVALGYSITVPVLERHTKIYVVALTVIYGVDSALQEYVWVIRTMGLEFPRLLEFIAWAVFVLANVCYVAWVGFSLLSQWKSLSATRQTQKLSMYQKFAAFLVIFLLFSVVLFFVQTGLTALNRRDELWQLWWIWDAYWEFGYFFVVLLISVLWWPNENNERYAFSVQIQADGEELDDIGLPEDLEDDSKPGMDDNTDEKITNNTVIQEEEEDSDSEV